MASQLPDIRYYPSVQKGKADFALIAQGRQVMRGLKITHVIWGKSADKHFVEVCTSAHTGIRTSDFPACPDGTGAV